MRIRHKATRCDDWSKFVADHSICPACGMTVCVTCTDSSHTSPARQSEKCRSREQLALRKAAEYTKRIAAEVEGYANSAHIAYQTLSGEMPASVPLPPNDRLLRSIALDIVRLDPNLQNEPVLRFVLMDRDPYSPTGRQ